MKLLLFNTENLFLSGEHLNSSMRKPHEKIVEIKKIIEENDAEINMLLEVGGVQSLIDFNEQYLNNKYDVHLLPGNSDRGIEMGYLTKKNSKFTYQIHSHASREITLNQMGLITEKSKFSRDISELHVIENHELKMIILLVHLKSKWDREGNDPGGAIKRKAECTSLIELYSEYQHSHPNIPTIVAGDMNGVAALENHEPEFNAIYDNSDLRDCLEVMKVADSDRHTYFQFNREGKRVGFQLDYIFVPASLQNKIIKENSGVYRFNLAPNSPFVPPQSIYERAALPSDHYPVILTLDFLK